MRKNKTNWAGRDLKHVWHPCSQMKDYEQLQPLIVKSAQGSYIELITGEKLIDATSSWWCKSLGHNHPKLRAALLKQAEKFEHVILANTTNEIIVRLSEQLALLTSNLNKVVYASDGACAIEMAMKMSLHARKILNQKDRHQFIALAGDYHGETCGALAVSDLGIYRKPYEDMLIKTHFLQNIPYVANQSDPLWSDCSKYWPKIETQLAEHAKHLTAIVVEPIIQGSNGMLIYSADFLHRLAQWAKMHDIHLIADEIMTGLGRTGTMLACEHATIKPDFLCLGKGLTGGWLPLSATITSDEIYNLFYDDYELGKSFLHSHTYAGNALAASIALTCLKCIEEENVLRHVNSNATLMLELMQKTATQTGRLERIRHIGAIIAADLILDNPQERKGFQIFQKAVKRGALLRPLGNTIYWMPPLNISRDTLETLQNITAESINAVF